MFFVADVLFLFFLFVCFFKKLLHVYMCLPKTPEVEWFIFFKKNHCVYGPLFRNCKRNKLFSPFTVKHLFSAPLSPRPL